MNRYFIFLLLLSISILAVSTVSAADSTSEVQDAINAHSVVVLYFWGEDCEPCTYVTPIMDNIATTYSGEVYVFKLNLSEGETALRVAYSVTGTPTVVILDQFGNIHNQKHEGQKSASFYIAEVESALRVDDDLRSSALFKYNLAESYFSLGNYQDAKFQYNESLDLYRQLDFLSTANDIANQLFCELQIKKCDNYINAEYYLVRADDSFALAEYSKAKANYTLAYNAYDLVNDTDLMDYCSEQIAKCELYPTLDSQYVDALDLLDGHDYVSALALLVSVHSGYADLGESDLASEVQAYIDLSEDYISANQLYAEASNALTEKNYASAISLFTQAREIYSVYSDTNRIDLCNQNISLAQQYAEMDETPVPTTTPPPSQPNSSGTGNPYVIYGALAVVLGFVFILVIYALRPKFPSRTPKNEVLYTKKQSALDMVSNKLLEDAPFAESPKKAHILPPIEPSSTTPPAGKSDVRSQVIDKKNELLYFFLLWSEELLDEFKRAQPMEYFSMRGKFDQLYAFFSRSFSSDEAYLDKSLYKQVQTSLHSCQSALNDLMDLM